MNFSANTVVSSDTNAQGLASQLAVGPGMLIQIVDDTPANLAVMSEALHDAGFEVALATNGTQALKQLSRQHPDLILLDVMMPGLTGFEVCSHLKQNPDTAKIPVIFMTALSDLASKTKGFELGAVDYITKPFQEQEAIARIKLHLQLHSLTTTLEQQVAQRTADLSEALRSLQSSQIQLVQREKMSALGNLVAGVAHEINNPLGFVLGNLRYIAQATTDLFELIDLYQQHYPQPEAAIEDAIASIDLPYVKGDFPQLIQSTQSGLERIRDISNSLRTFSRADSDRPIAFQLQDGIDSTLLILKHRLKENDVRPEIQVIKRYGDLPLVTCYAGQVNQVFMNLLANAIDAVNERYGQRESVLPNTAQTEAAPSPRPDPEIHIQTALTANADAVQVQIKDTGIGMSSAIQHKIFDQRFTTKAVGQGTGLGLAIVHQIITEKHGGTITVDSTPGKGSTFTITLPLAVE
jgi:signal transduction histidine kinase